MTTQTQTGDDEGKLSDEELDAYENERKFLNGIADTIERGLGDDRRFTLLAYDAIEPSDDNEKELVMHILSNASTRLTALALHAGSEKMKHSALEEVLGELVKQEGFHEFLTDAMAKITTKLEAARAAHEKDSNDDTTH